MTDSKNNPAPDIAELRQRAEEKLQMAEVKISLGELSAIDAARLFHELRVHQIELEMQNQELREAQWRLEAVSDRYSELYDFAPVGYLTVDDQGVILEINLTACKFLGGERTKLLGRYFPLFFPEQDRQALRHLLANHLQLAERQGEFHLQDGDGKMRPMLLNILCLKDAEGLETRQVTLTDISDLKQVQVELQESKNKVLRLNKTLEQRVKERTAELEQANRELESFSYSVSHDLKTPLRAIQGFSRMLLEEHTAGLDAEGRRLFQVVIDNTNLMDRLIDDLLNLARLARQPLDKMAVDLTSMAQGVFSRLKSQEPERDLQFNVHEAPLASGDYHLLQQVIANLMENAVKFTRGKTHAIIEMGGRFANGENIYYLKDNGAGFDPDYAHKLFHVFQRLHLCREFSGTGVGLATVQRIIQRHGGRVWAESQVDEGATFYFSLPAPPPQAEENN